jgi:hypothetical protein
VDLFYLALSVALVLSALALVRLCERLGRIEE